jgi:hypothetical protein
MRTFGGTRSGIVSGMVREMVPGIVLVLAALLAGGCAGDEGDEADPGEGSGPPTTRDSATSDGSDATTTSAPGDLPADYVGHSSDQYADGAHWLCHPQDADENVCDRDLTTTLVRPDGTTEVEEHTPTEDPAVDCFYVYPTISADPGLNADLEPGDNEEIRAAVNQVARLNSVCEIYAPVYRQLTIASLVQRMSGEADEAAMDEAGRTAYGDVVDAWKHYMANDNQGRGVILVGHSQGSGMLTDLIAEEIDDEPLLRERIVAAYLLGTDLAVPQGEDVGGTFDNMPLCRADDQTGCVVAYASFPASLPPTADSLFGAVEQNGEGEELVAACTNPAALGGGSGDLLAYFTTTETLANLEDLPPVDTDWVGLRDSLTAECQVRNGFSVLEVTVNGDPTDTRDQNLSGGLGPNWGLHLADANLAMGNLVALAASQAEAYAG